MKNLPQGEGLPRGNSEKGSILPTKDPHAGGFGGDELPRDRSTVKHGEIIFV